MTHRIEIVSREGSLPVHVYTIDKTFSRSELERIAAALTNPVSQRAFVDMPYTPRAFRFAIEVGYLPGVTDNVAATTKEIIEDLLRIKFVGQEHVYSSRVTFIEKLVSLKEAEKIAEGMYNPIIQRVKIKSRDQFKKEKGMGVEVPRVELRQSVKVDEVNLNVSDAELVEIGKKGIANSDGTRRGPLALDLLFMKTAQSYFKKLGRNPTDIELESIAQTWSEHCKHTIFADPMDEVKYGLFRTYIKAATEKIRSTLCVSVFTDNSGAIEFDQDYLITHKVETHNSPSALDPFGGAITGIGGVNRDAIGFGMGAKPVVNYYGFCFADPQDETPLYKGPNFTQKMLSARRIMEEVIAGVNSGGNCSGIPTPQGFMYFDKRYKGKPLVFVGTVGLIPKRIKGKKSYVKKARPGDYVVMVGGRVGLDGIHGATFSSEAMDSRSPATAVQIGDPITQKKLSDAIVKEARGMGLYNSITDNGAGGLSCSAAEMAKESGGCRVDLEKVPLKYPGLAPWQIWVSESQERMTLAVPKRKWSVFQRLMKRRGVEASVIGVFTDSGKCVVNYKGKTIMEIGMKFLHDGLPSRPMNTVYRPPHHPEPTLAQPKHLTRTMEQMVKRPNIASYEFVSMQYDYEVQGGSVLKPLQGSGRVNGDATVVRPLLHSKKGVVLSQGIYPGYSDIDTYHMAASCIDTAIRNAVAAGASVDKLVLLDNFCWCSPGDPQRLGQLKRAAKACYDYAVAYGTPFISGKDSMFNDFKGYDARGRPIMISIPPTLLVSSIGIVDDTMRFVSIDLKSPGDLVYVLGETSDELGGSEYYAMRGVVGNSIPQVDAVRNKRLYRDFFRCVEKGMISSAVSVGRGGLGVALAKGAMAGKLGVDVSLKKLPGRWRRDDFALFSETQGRLLVSIRPANKERFEKILRGSSFICIGKATEESAYSIRGKRNNVVVDTDVHVLLKAYRSTFKNY